MVANGCVCPNKEHPDDGPDFDRCAQLDSSVENKEAKGCPDEGFQLDLCESNVEHSQSLGSTVLESPCAGMLLPAEAPSDMPFNKDQEEELGGTHANAIDVIGCLQSESFEPSASEDQSVRDVQIFLHIYDVTHASAVQWLNSIFANVHSPVKFAGMVHIGVQIGFNEWSFGYAAHGTGVFSSTPCCTATHHYRQTVPMGPTKLSKGQIATVISELQSEWAGSSYNLLSRNCVHFADALCQHLEIGRVPEWTMRDLVQISHSHGSRHVQHVGRSF